MWCEVEGDEAPGVLDRWRAIWEMRWVEMVEGEGVAVGREERVEDGESGGGVELADVEIGRAVRGRCGSIGRAAWGL